MHVPGCTRSGRTYRSKTTGQASVWIFVRYIFKTPAASRSYCRGGVIEKYPASANGETQTDTIAAVPAHRPHVWFAIRWIGRPYRRRAQPPEPLHGPTRVYHD